MKTNRGFALILGIIIAVIVLGGGYYVYQLAGGDVRVNLPPLERGDSDEGGFTTPKPSTPTEPVACTMEAKICPDGSAVGRTGPKCEFAACPLVQENKNWLVYKNTQYNFQFKYPEVLSDFVVSKKIKGLFSARSSARETVVVSGRVVSKYPSLVFSVFDLASYASKDVPGGTSLTYDKTSNNCVTSHITGEAPNITPAEKIGSWYACRVGTGDAGFSYSAYAVILPPKELVVEIGFSSDEASNEPGFGSDSSVTLREIVRSLSLL